MIVRGEEAVLPRGSTRVEAGDRLHVVVRTEVAAGMDEVVDALEHGAGRWATRCRAGG